METTFVVSLKQRAVTEFLNAEDCKPIDIHARLLVVCGDGTIGISDVRRWVPRTSRRQIREKRTSTTFHDVDARTGDRRTRSHLVSTRLSAITDALERREITVSFGISRKRARAIFRSSSTVENFVLVACHDDSPKTRGKNDWTTVTGRPARYRREGDGLLVQQIVTYSGRPGFVIIIV